MTPIVGDVIDNVFELVNGWIKRKFPDPAEQEKARKEWEQYSADNQYREVQQFHDFVIQYEGQGDKVDPWLQRYRGSVRPTVTYILIAAFIWGIMDGWKEELIDLIYRLNLISMTFWYGERALKNLGLDFKSIFTKGTK